MYTAAEACTENVRRAVGRLTIASGRSNARNVGNPGNVSTKVVKMCVGLRS